MDQILNKIPFSTDPAQIALTAIALLSLILLLSSCLKALQGKDGPLPDAVSSTLAILLIYTISVTGFIGGEPFDSLQEYLPPLPFLTLDTHTVSVIQLESIGLDRLCSEIVYFMILAAMVNLADSMLPRGEHFIPWIFFRTITIAVPIILFGMIPTDIATDFSDFGAVNSPYILMAIVGVMMAVGCLKYFVGFAIATVNPILAALYTFFVAGVTGQLISKTLLTTLFIFLIIWGLHFTNLSVISPDPYGIYLYGALICLLTALWYRFHSSFKE